MSKITVGLDVNDPDPVEIVAKELSVTENMIEIRSVVNFESYAGHSCSGYLVYVDTTAEDERPAFRFVHVNWMTGDVDHL